MSSLASQELGEGVPIPTERWGRDQGLAEHLLSSSSFIPHQPTPAEDAAGGEQQSETGDESVKDPESSSAGKL